MTRVPLDPPPPLAPRGPRARAWGVVAPILVGLLIVAAFVGLAAFLASTLGADQPPVFVTTCDNGNRLYFGENGSIAVAPGDLTCPLVIVE